MIVRYVVGLLFSQGQVLLIRKARPEWQKGKLNGVGGHVEPGENDLEAMHREFREETGLSGMVWELFALYGGTEDGTKRGATGGEGQGFTISFFRAEIKAPLKVYNTDNQEPLEWRPAFFINLHAHETLPNIQWLVPMALYARRDDWPFSIGERGDIAFMEEEILEIDGDGKVHGIPPRIVRDPGT